jgi:hypothetical protein
MSVDAIETFNGIGPKRMQEINVYRIKYRE